MLLKKKKKSCSRSVTNSTARGLVPIVFMIIIHMTMYPQPQYNCLPMLLQLVLILARASTNPDGVSPVHPKYVCRD